MANVLDLKLQSYIVPLPLDSVNAFHVLSMHKIRPDIIHIDAGHDYTSVTSDLRSWWPLLQDGGILVGDDYYTDGKWPEVQKGFDDFLAANLHQFIQS